MLKLEANLFPDISRFFSPNLKGNYMYVHKDHKHKFKDIMVEVFKLL